MHANSSRIMNTPPCVALVDMNKRDYYLIYFERFNDLKTSVRLSGPAADSVNVLVAREETIRSCDVSVQTGIGIECFPNSADGLTLVQVNDLIRATIRYRKNNDDFEAIEMAVEDLLQIPWTNAGLTRVNAAGGLLLNIGRDANYSEGRGFAFYAPILLFNNDDVEITMTLSADGALAAVDMDIKTAEYVTKMSTNPQGGPFSGCDYALARCGPNGEPTNLLIGPDMYPNVIPTVGNAISASARFPQPGVAPVGPAGGSHVNGGLLAPGGIV